MTTIQAVPFVARTVSVVFTSDNWQRLLVCCHPRTLAGAEFEDTVSSYTTCLRVCAGRRVRLMLFFEPESYRINRTLQERHVPTAIPSGLTALPKPSVSCLLIARAPSGSGSHASQAAKTNADGTR